MSDIICLLVGESGSGKTSICDALERTYDLQALASYTTRPSRYVGETGHTFITEEEFDTLTNLVAHTTFCGYRYAATCEQVDTSDLYVIDMDGIDYFRKNYKGNKRAVVVYIHSPIHTRVERMEKRGDKFGAIMERIVNDATAFAKAKESADLILYNNDDTQIEDLAERIYAQVFTQQGGENI